MSSAFKNNTPFIICVSKANNVLIDYAEDLDVVIPMYNLIEYSKNYRKAINYNIILKKMFRLLLY